MITIMDFSSFNLKGNGDLFKQNYQVESNNDNDASTDFFNFMDDNSNAFENNGSFTVPHLSPGQGSFTNSSALSGHNPEFNMSPLQIASQHTNPIIQTYHTPLQHPMQNNHLEDFADDEVIVLIVFKYLLLNKHDRNFLHL